MAPEQKHSQVQKTITTAAKKVLTSAVSEYTRSKSGNMLNKDIVAIGKVVYISDDDAVLRDMEETAQIDTRQVVNKCKNVGTGDGSVGKEWSIIMGNVDVTDIRATASVRRPGWRGRGPSISGGNE
ncbi:hypothetical protein L917_11241 [Phytophthora nicotianae]|uniref:Uncharacterized protein n=1 Tax=Phytophthora nicotianae TaxID=4792 RepID=W2N3P9_PHYNI|nr:hypothetical protein L917_11241 [Phytophthora nicotianae]ETM43180.1 hypothetical protein L914_11287 [Phytophthora nicotianae]